MNITVTKEFAFEAAHFLPDHLGQCRNLHGHSYRLQITVSGALQTSGPSNGMICDFAELKRVVNENIVSKMDHAVLVHSKSAGKGLEKAVQLNAENSSIYPQKWLNIEEVTTAENLVIYIAELLRPYLAEELGVNLVKVRLYETATGYAEIEL